MCSATGVVYASNVDKLLMNYDTSVDAITEDLTACGYQLYSCPSVRCGADGVGTLTTQCGYIFGDFQ